MSTPPSSQLPRKPAIALLFLLAGIGLFQLSQLANTMPKLNFEGWMGGPPPPLRPTYEPWDRRILCVLLGGYFACGVVASLISHRVSRKGLVLLAHLLPLPLVFGSGLGGFFVGLGLLCVFFLPLSGAWRSLVPPESWLIADEPEPPPSLP